MQTTVFHPIGAQITDIDLNRVDAETVAELKRLLADHGAVVVPAQNLDDDAFLAFLRRFGDLMFSKGETPLNGFPDLNVISNVGRATPPRSVFHVDTSYVRHPPAYTALRAVEIPAHGGETLFTNQYRAFETLPREVRATLEGRTITHVVTGLALNDDDESAAEHSIFLRHPVSGRTSLFISTPERCVDISGLDHAAATKMIEFLYAHSTATDNIYRHTWSARDVVMWDNRCVLHRADHGDVVGDRVMHRGMVAPDRGSQPARSTAA